jgi:hypothetical protein
MAQGLLAKMPAEEPAAEAPDPDPHQDEKCRLLRLLFRQGGRGDATGARTWEHYKGLTAEEKKKFLEELVAHRNSLTWYRQP